jgi:hypothetical protein
MRVLSLESYYLNQFRTCSKFVELNDTNISDYMSASHFSFIQGGAQTEALSQNFILIFYRIYAK